MLFSRGGICLKYRRVRLCLLPQGRKESHESYRFPAVKRSVEGAHSTFGRDCTPVLRVVSAFFDFLRAGRQGRRGGRKRRRGKSAQHAPRGFQLVLRQPVHQPMKPIPCGHAHVFTPMLWGAGQARPHAQANLSLGARQSNRMQSGCGLDGAGRATRPHSPQCTPAPRRRGAGFRGGPGRGRGRRGRRPARSYRCAGSPGPARR